MSICSCPVGTSIPSIPNQGCPSNFGQIQKIAFQRIFSSGTTRNKFVEGTGSDANPIGALDSWSDLLSATNGTKVVISPYVEAPASEGGDAITFGGGNDTPGGETRTIGRNPVNMTFVMRSIAQSIVKAMKGLSCENLGVYFFNGDNQVLSLKGGSDEHMPIPISNLFVGDLMLNGLDTPDSNALSFQLKPNWSDDVEISELEFNPLTDLVNS